MDDKQSAIIMQLMQSLGASGSEDNSFEKVLIGLKPMLAPRQQKILELIIKMQEIQTLLDEINM